MACRTCRSSLRGIRACRGQFFLSPRAAGRGNGCKLLSGRELPGGIVRSVSPGCRPVAHPPPEKQTAPYKDRGQQNKPVGEEDPAALVRGGEGPGEGRDGMLHLQGERDSAVRSAQPQDVRLGRIAVHGGMGRPGTLQSHGHPARRLICPAGSEAETAKCPHRIPPPPEDGAYHEYAGPEGQGAVERARLHGITMSGRREKNSPGSGTARQVTSKRRANRERTRKTNNLKQPEQRSLPAFSDFAFFASFRGWTP